MQVRVQTIATGPVPQRALKEAEEAAVKARTELDEFLAGERSYEDYQKQNGHFSTSNFLLLCGGPILGMFLASKIQTGPAAFVALGAGMIGGPALSLFLATKSKNDKARHQYDEAQTLKQSLVQTEQQARTHRDQLYQQNLKFLEGGGKVEEIDFKQDEDFLFVGDQILPRGQD